MLLPDVVITGFLRVVTNRRISIDPAPATVALAFVEAMRGSPIEHTLNPTDATWCQFGQFISSDSYLADNLVPDAWIAALAVASGARVATADADFARFKGLAWFKVQPRRRLRASADRQVLAVETTQTGPYPLTL